ncbi:MAG: putative rane protein [Verrucomicrobiaceae bacterium]|nr:putative rane protein [Verrucomicrobiaceae bacterium]
MNALLWCLVVVTFLPVAWGVPAFSFRKKQFGYADNKLPRAQQQQTTGIAARALGAHQNAWEALMMFAPIVFVAQIAGADPVKAGLTGIAFVVIRVLHGIFYIADLDALRSISFLVGIACLIRLVVLSV